MQTICLSTAESITEVLLAGDVVLNLSSRELHTGAGTRFVTVTPHGLGIAEDIRGSVSPDRRMLASVPALMKANASRIVVVVDEDVVNVDEIASVLRRQDVPHVICQLQAACDQSSFMDEEDTEAVTERLRQLGYI